MSTFAPKTVSIESSGSVPFHRVAVLLLCVLVGVSGLGCARNRGRSVAPGFGSSPSQRTVPGDNVPSIWPVSHPQMRISSPYGEARGGGRLHKGIDMSVPSGTPVVATASGTTMFTGWRGAYGNLVVLCHGNGYETAYAHLERVLTRPGDRVGRGEHIGLVGATGNATGPHLHYEVRRQGEAVDPRPWLP